MRLGCTEAMALKILCKFISGRSHTFSLSAPNRSARKRTCCALSSAVTYNVRAGHAARSCMSSVLLPMPGSPPSKVTEPGTMPPPNTRSSSGIVVACGWPIEPSTSVMGLASPGATSDMPAASDTSGSSGPSTSSTSEFHAPQVMHRPDHLG